MKFTPALLLPLLFLPLLTPGQSGPAGVGTSLNNPLWLKADAGTSTTTNVNPVSSWNDQSGNGINVGQTNSGQQPLFRTNILNGFPALQFDNVSTSGQNDFMWAPDNNLLDNTTGYSFFMVVEMDYLGSARSIISKRTNIDSYESFMLFFYTGNNFFVDMDGLNDRFNTPSPSFTTNTPYLLNVMYDGSLPASSRVKVFKEELLKATGYESSNSVPNMPSPLVVGATHTGDNRPFGGYMAEIIIYTTALNDASRIIVNNYLSAKYNLPLNANDYYAGDNGANGDYDFDVAGIGRTSNGSNNTFQASTCAGLSLSVNSGLDIGDFVIAGHNTVNNDQITSDVGGMTGSNNSRWQRAWYVDVTNSGSSLNLGVEFDMSDGGFPSLTTGPASNYVLLYRTGTTGNWTELAVANATPGDKVIFNSVSFTNDGYYTVGSRDMANSPLPVQLTRFTGDCRNNIISIEWETVSENNSKDFVVEYSSDGINFSELYSTPAAGNSNSPLKYSYTGEGNLKGFYQLRQTDLDGKSYKYGPLWIACEKEKNEVPIIYPNPAAESLTLDLPDHFKGRVDIYSITGQKVWTAEISDDYVLNVSDFSRGIYVVHFTDFENGDFFMNKLTITSRE